MRNEQYKAFNCYTVLTISFLASPKEIKDAWRAASMVAHPDRGGSNEAQQRVNLAYEVLSDPIQRRQHDIFWAIGRATGTQSQKQANSDYRQRSSENYNQTTSGESLKGFQTRLEATINSKKLDIWSALYRRSEARFQDFKQKRENKRQSAVLWTAATAAAVSLAIWKPAFWFVPPIPFFIFVSAWSGLKLGNHSVGLLESVSEETLRKYARDEVAESCHREAAAFDKYSRYFASVLELALRPSSFDDSEDQVARRLVVSFFFSGYIPESYDAQSRIIVLADGDEKIAVRFRHRSGAAVNISYLKGLADHVRFRSGTKGILFCSPGLSGNAAEYASQQGIRWHTLETMNDWIDSVLKEDAPGPTGDILEHIEFLNQFLSQISTRVGFSSRGYRKRRRRRW